MRTTLMMCMAVAVTACGGGDPTTDASGSGHDATGGHDAATDGHVAVDAPPATVVAVDCASVTPDATVTDANFMYTSTPAGAASNDSAIPLNGVVEFNLVPAMSHPVGPDSAAGMTDSGLKAPDNKATCLKFTASGTFHYRCTVHGFKGTVTVAP